jgi:hypothetical protein
MKKALVIIVALSFLLPAIGAAADWQYLHTQNGLQFVQVINDNKSQVAISRPKLAKKTYYLLFKAPKASRPIGGCQGNDCHSLRIRVDDKAIHTLDVEQAINNTNVLTFFFPEDLKLMQEMKSGYSMMVSYYDGISKQPRVEKFSLMGLTAALGQFEKSQGGI